MRTSYEDRLAMLQEFSDGSLAFHANIPTALQIKGDGWELTSSDSRFPMFNGVVIQSGRKEAADEVIAALATHDVVADIRLVGPGIVHISALAEHGYKNLGGTPFMLWNADDSLKDFTLRQELSARRLTLADLETMGQIYMDVYSMSAEVIVDFNRMLFATENDYTYGLFKDSEMVSLVSAMIYKDSIGIWSMGTPTAHQKNGYGEQLLKHVMKTHAQMGAKRFYLHASAAGKFLYDKCGWITLDYLPYLSKVDSH
ncbi:MAG: GNAT family N-acetyltransferase [Candidatus Nanopelagicales bacterium]